MAGQGSGTTGGGRGQDRADAAVRRDAAARPDAAVRPDAEVFAGRVRESARLAECAAEARAGRARLAVIEGEAGIGKSALAHRLAGALPDFTVLWAIGLAAPTAARGGLPALTERELSVAYLIAEGRTNQQAAAELYVTQKTVEYHLSNIYGKLGLASRQRLADIVRAEQS